MTDAPPIPPEVQKFLTACIDVIGHTGAEGWQLRYDDDEEPTVWIAVATYSHGRHECAASMSPVNAAYRLVERLVDGGTCAHCLQPTVAEDNWERPISEVFAGLDGHMCWRVYDPELGRFERSCRETHPTPDEDTTFE